MVREGCHRGEGGIATGGKEGLPQRQRVIPVACLLELQKLLGSLAEFCHLLLVRHILLMVRMLLQLQKALLQQALHLQAGRNKVKT